MRWKKRCAVLLVERIGRHWYVKTWFGLRPSGKERHLCEAYTIDLVTCRTPWGLLEEEGLLEEVEEGTPLPPRTPIPPNIVQLVAARAAYYREQRVRDTESTQIYRRLRVIRAKDALLNIEHPIVETPTYRRLCDGSMWSREVGGEWTRIDTPATTPTTSTGTTSTSGTVCPQQIGSIRSPLPPVNQSTTSHT